MQAYENVGCKNCKNVQYECRNYNSVPLVVTTVTCLYELELCTTGYNHCNMFIRMEGSLSTFLLTERVVSIKASLYHIRIRFISCACVLSAYLKSLASPSGAKSSSNGRDFWMPELNFEGNGISMLLGLAESGRFCRKRKTE